MLAVSSLAILQYSANAHGGSYCNIFFLKNPPFNILQYWVDEGDCQKPKIKTLKLIWLLPEQKNAACLVLNASLITLSNC